jgi:mannose-6-phosphate isomerase-like protein (cupin superfamily)
VPPEPIALGSVAGRLTEYWRPRLVAELNGQAVKVVKVLGEFVWHRHESEDELFLVLSGRLRIEFRDGSRDIGPGECIVVPRGVDHRPVADVETTMLLFEPLGVRNTGNVSHDTLTAPIDDRG